MWRDCDRKGARTDGLMDGYENGVPFSHVVKSLLPRLILIWVDVPEFASERCVLYVWEAYQPLQEV